MKITFNPDIENRNSTGAELLTRLGALTEPTELAAWIGEALELADLSDRGWLLWQGDESWVLHPLRGEKSIELEAEHPLVKAVAALNLGDLVPGGLLESGSAWTVHPLTPEDASMRVLLLLQEMGPEDLFSLSSLAAERLVLRMGRAAMNRRTAEVEEQQASFLSIINHELRTPLTAILGFADLTLDLPVVQADRILRQFLEGIRFSARNLNQRISELLTMGGISSASLQVEREACPLPVLMEEFRLQVLPDIVGHERVSIPDELPELVLRADKQHFLRILTHLVDNALKFTAPGESVELRFSFLKGRRASDTGDYLRADVIDTGPGIPEAEREKIFEKFYQVESIDTRSRGGLGLGLTLAREFTEAMGGKLWLDGESVAGSTFSFTLPLAD